MSSRTPDGDLLATRIAEVVERVSAPQSLRDAVALQKEGRSASADRPSPGAGARLAPVAGIATLFLIVCVAIVIGLGGSSDTAVSQQQVVGLALAPVGGDAPGVDARDPAFLKLGVGRVRFPDLGYGGFAVGSRTDEIAGRRAVTVRYATDDGYIGYTVVQSTAVSAPGSARRVRSGSVRAAVSRRGGVLVVMWRRYGHTCLLASRTAGEAQLLGMAGLV